jgi:hypothetical protein
MKNNEVEGTCDTYGGQERCIEGFGGIDLKERVHLDYLGVDGSIILRRLLMSSLVQ